MSNNQHLVLIAGKKLYRYEGGKRVEEADVQDTWEDLTIAERKDLIEDFRKNGLPPPVIRPADEAFFVATHEMQTKRPLEGMELSELLALWNMDLQEGDMVDGHRIEDVWKELDRRGVKMPRG